MRIVFALLLLAGCTDGNAPPDLVDQGIPDEGNDDLSTPDLGPDLLNRDALFGLLQPDRFKPTIVYGLSGWAHSPPDHRKMKKRTS